MPSEYLRDSQFTGKETDFDMGMSLPKIIDGNLWKLI